jgi:hypothetical protein
MVLNNSARGETYLVQAELTAASPRTVSLEHVFNLYEVLDKLHPSCSLQPGPFFSHPPHIILMTDNKMIC